ncbi:hypothetical protein ACP3P8_07930 [Pseudomonas aeruginosa]
MNPPVFYGAAILILLFAAVVIGFQRAGEWLLAAQTWASQTVGWYYLLAMTLYLIFVVVTALPATARSSSVPTTTSRNSATCPGPACCSPPASASPCSSSAYPNR